MRLKVAEHENRYVCTILCCAIEYKINYYQSVTKILGKRREFRLRINVRKIPQSGNTTNDVTRLFQNKTPQKFYLELSFSAFRNSYQSFKCQRKNEDGARQQRVRENIRYIYTSLSYGQNIFLPRGVFLSFISLI